MSERRAHVLVVDDDREDYLITRELLAEIPGVSYDLEWAIDVDAGLESFSRGWPDVALIDYRLGVRDGLELVREVAGRGDAPPLIVLTGRDDPRLDLESMRAGAADYLIKGRISAPTLERSLRYALFRGQAERDLRAAKAEAEAASRAKDHFLAIVSHELRNPLAPVLLAVSSLLQGDLGPDLRSTLEMIRRNVELEARLIDDLLDVSRIAHVGLDLRIERLDVHDTIRRALDYCRGECQAAGLAIGLDLSAASHHVDADPARMMQVFWNLIRNAAKFTPAPGSLAIRTLVEAGDATRGDRLVVEFRDDGRGIAAEMLPSIFEPFEQGDGARQGRGGGLGLGLSIGRAIAEAHGGSLTASSPGVGQGATFRLEQAPAAPPAPARDVEASGPSLSAPSAGLRILLVEDNPDILRHAALALRLRGHDVTPAASLAEAREAGPRFDLLVCDMELPDGRGTELMRELRGQIPGIAVSGYSSEGDVQESLAAGFDDHLAKPIDIGRLEIAIRRAIPCGVPSGNGHGDR